MNDNLERIQHILNDTLKFNVQDLQEDYQQKRKVQEKPTAKNIYQKMLPCSNKNIFPWIKKTQVNNTIPAETRCVKQRHAHLERM